MSRIVARATLARDVAAVDALVRKTAKADANCTLLLGSALLNLTAHDDRDVVVGYMCLDDVPCVRLGSGSAGAEAWVAEAAASRHKLGNSAFVRAYSTSQLFEVEAATALLRAAFLGIPSLQRLLLAASGDLGFAEPGLAAVFTRVAASKDSGVVLYETTRTAVVPPLAIRAARVEDHDDMLPILQRCKQTFPALAKLPDSSNPQEPFALTRVVAGQDERNRVLVAEADGKLVGFILMTSDVDTGSLSETFDLHPYDNFLPSEVYAEQYEAAKASIRGQKMEYLRAQAAAQREEAGEEQAGVEEGTQADGDATAEGTGDGADGAAAEQQAEGEGDGEERPSSSQAAKAEKRGIDESELAAAAEPTEEETRAEMLAMFAGQPAPAEPTLYAITMLCMDPAYEAQASEFLGPAFAAFADKLYCVVTLPHDSRVPGLMDTMTRIAPIPGSLFPEVLFMINRHALLPDFEVRLGSPSDLPLVSSLVEGMPNSGDICASFQGAAEAGTAAVALCQGELVGLCTVNPEVDLELLQSNFGLANHVDLAYQPRVQHGEIDMYTMNPIFVHHHRAFLAGAMRLLGKTALYYALPPGQQPPDMQEVLEQVAPRHRGGDKQTLAAEFALYVFTRQAAFKRRRTVNSQIVIVGASECGLAVLERLLLDPELQFNYLTLLAPGGIKVGGMACQYTAGVIARLGFEARVLLLDAEMVGLDRAARVVDLSDGSQLAYNQLLITAGTQDQSRYHFADADPEVAGLLVTELELAADFTMNDAMVMSSILVYGNALGAYHSLSVLEAKGAADKTRFVAPPGQEPPVVRLLHELAEEAGVTLPRPEPREVSSLLVAQPGGTELHATATLVDPADPGPREELQVDLFVGCEPPGVSRALFTCLNDASIVFDGRVVVDGALRTNDKNIYAAGTLAKLSRRFGGVSLENHNSRDAGAKLAASLTAFFSASDSASGSGPDPSAPPALHRARAVGCTLPGNTYFMYAACPSAMAVASLHAPEGGLEMVTKTDRGLMRVNIDSDGCVHSLMYLGRVPVSAPRLSALVGLHANYLNQLIPRYQAGEVHDLLTHLTEPWAELLYNDGFWDFRQQLLEVALASVAVGGRDTEGGLVEMVTAAQDAVLEYARAHAAELPGYEVPAASRT